MTCVLIIEDEDPIRQNIAETLSYEGFATIKAENGLVGVQLARDHLPDLIVCDIMMPELDGYGVLFKLRADPATATIPFIFLTARADKPSFRQGMELGADDYLTKPFTPDELVKAVISRLEKQAQMVQEYENKLEELRENLITLLPHELRTPLTAVIGYSDLLIMDGETLDRRQIVDMATMINLGGQRLLHLIENYLLYAQIEMLRFDPDRVKRLRKHTTENPPELIAQIAAHLAGKAGREQDVSVQVESAQVQISGDHLRRIVEELVDNALKFSSKGTRVDVRAHADEGFFTLQITNRGRGVTPEQIKKLGAYMQFERKLYEQQGSGLGLIIARRLAELYGGTLTIESIPGEWITVHVPLPLS